MLVTVFYTSTNIKKAGKKIVIYNSTIGISIKQFYYRNGGKTEIIFS